MKNFMHHQKSKIEAILAGSGEPITFSAIAHLTGVSTQEAADTINSLQKEYEENSRGIRIATNGKSAELTTSPEHATVMQKFIKDEETALTQAQIDTLAILSYRGPLTRAELEDIRGVNCAVILKNLTIAGLVEEFSASPHQTYNISTTFLRGLGVERVQQLPEYYELNQKITSMPA
ncbi:MAG TPA: hypothetical protein DEP08_02600 [Candidatus Jacksonbacteria bacterium]|nr:MAG: Segregation and condensation protein B [Parcubacteria group bacterium GW2011_GWF2_44_17]HCE86663.1 hypothetical protein [Candidatus Jacksonbacteria bacterium]